MRPILRLPAPNILSTAPFLRELLRTLLITKTRLTCDRTPLRQLIWGSEGGSQEIRFKLPLEGELEATSPCCAQCGVYRRDGPDNSSKSYPKPETPNPN